MKRIFKFKKEQLWDGDEDVIHFLIERLLNEHWQIKDNFKVTVIVEKEKN